jgi:hypothetical protein
MPSFGGEVKQSVPCPSFGACKRTHLSSENCEIAGQIPLVPSFAGGVRCVSGQYAAFSGGEGGKFQAALTIQEQLRTIQSTLKVQYQNNEAQNTNKKEA